jgi:predicted  nucleic acid-binding Zn-ribbon protein
MANQEWESRMNELRDSQLVSQRLLERVEQTVRDNSEQLRALTSVVLRHENDIAELRSRHENDIHEHQVSIGAHQVSIDELRAMMASLITNIERFIQGRQSNGH